MPAQPVEYMPPGKFPGKLLKTFFAFVDYIPSKNFPAEMPE